MEEDEDDEDDGGPEAQKENADDEDEDEEEIISDLSEELKNWESSSESATPEESSVGSLANRSRKIRMVAKQARDIEKEKKR